MNNQTRLKAAIFYTLHGLECNNVPVNQTSAHHGVNSEAVINRTAKIVIREHLDKEPIYYITP